MAQCNYWNVNNITFQRFTIGLFSKYTKNINTLYDNALIRHSMKAFTICGLDVSQKGYSKGIQKGLGALGSWFIIDAHCWRKTIVVMLMHPCWCIAYVCIK